MKGVVMLSFGSGNIPDRREPILHELQRGVEKGITIVNCSQCSRGLVTDKYAAGRVSTYVHNIMLFGLDACTYVCMHMHVYVYVYIRTYVCAYVRRWVGGWMQVCVCAFP